MPTTTPTAGPMSASLADLEAGAQGVLPSQLLTEAVKAGWVDGGDLAVPEANIQPGSIDLRLGDHAYATQYSFLPGQQTVAQRLADFTVERVDLRRGAVLEIRRPYLVPLVERLNLPAFVRGKANPKSSTGRLDVFTARHNRPKLPVRRDRAGLQRTVVGRDSPAVVRRPGADGPGSQPVAPDGGTFEIIGRGVVGGAPKPPPPLRRWTPSRQGRVRHLGRAFLEPRPEGGALGAGSATALNGTLRCST